MTRLNEEIFKAEASKPYEHQILIYLEHNASDELVEKMNGQTEKNIQNCFSYIKEQARKQASGGCACIEDKAVYGWAIHYFEEDSIKAKEPAKPNVEVKTKDNNGKDNVKISFKGSPHVKEIREAKKQLDRMEEDIVNPDHKPKTEKKQEKKPQKSTDIEGQFSLFDFLGGD